MMSLSEGIVAQHGEIAALIKELREAHAAGASWTDLAQRLDRLIGVVHEHFEGEQHAMNGASYPLLVEHSQNHDTFLRRLGVLRAECDRRETELMSVFMDLLDNWFKNHERTADQLVLDYLATRG